MRDCTYPFDVELNGHLLARGEVVREPQFARKVQEFGKNAGSMLSLYIL